jgi:hypothetical protein
MFFKLPIEVGENPELIVPAIVGEKAYESYQGLSQLYDWWTGRNIRSTPIASVPEVKIGTVPSFTPENKSLGSSLLHPPSNAVSGATLNNGSDFADTSSQQGTYIMAPPSYYQVPSIPSTAQPSEETEQEYLDRMFTERYARALAKVAAERKAVEEAKRLEEEKKRLEEEKVKVKPI